MTPAEREALQQGLHDAYGHSDPGIVSAIASRIDAARAAQAPVPEPFTHPRGVS